MSRQTFIRGMFFIVRYESRKRVTLLHQRQKALLQLLVKGNDAFSQMNELAEQLGCSPRTLRSDLNVLTEILKENGLPPVERVRGVGIRFLLNVDEKNKLEQWLNRRVHASPEKEAKERQLFILYHLLMSKTPLTLDYFSSQYYVSTPIIRADLDEIKKVCDRFNVSLQTIQRVGTHVIGSETDKRALLSYAVKQLGKVQLHEKKLLQFFESIEVTTVTLALKAIQKKYKLDFSSYSFEGLRLHALFTIKRVLLNQPVVVPYEKQLEIRQTHYYTWAKEFAEQTEVALAVRFPENEIAYLALHFQNVRLSKVRDELVNRPQWVDELVTSLMADVSELTGLPLKEDVTLHENLLLHLENTASRLENNFIISNPLLNEIKKAYVYLFYVVQNAVENYVDGKKMSLPEEEIGYLTVHFQTAVERLKVKPPKLIKTGIVCHYGVGVSAFIQARIENRFPDIQETILLSEEDVASAITDYSLDFILTTIPLSVELNVPTQQISPLLNEDEMEEIGNVLKGTSEKVANNERESWSLLDYTQPFLVHLQKDFKNRDDLLLFMAHELEKRGYVKEGYADTVLNREYRASTAIGKEIALPHGKPSLITSSVISCVTLKEPIQWGSDKVAVVFLFSLKKDDLKNSKAKGFFKFIQEVMADSVKWTKLKNETDVLTFLNEATIQKS